jgi:hypothetical protein
MSVFLLRVVKGVSVKPLTGSRVPLLILAQDSFHAVTINPKHFSSGDFSRCIQVQSKAGTLVGEGGFFTG